MPPIRAIGFPEIVAAVRRYERAGISATNKPVTLRWALGRVERGLPRLTPFAEAETELRPLLDELARPGTLTSHAYWRLKNDLGEYWEVAYDGPGAGATKEPPLTALRKGASAGFTAKVHAMLSDDSGLRQRTAALLDQLIEAGRPDSAANGTGRLERRSVGRIVRDVSFRANVLAAYRHRCVMCGYSGRLAGRTVGVEAAHVRGLANGGPETVDNGIALCALHHALFDAGAFTYGNDRRLIVSPAMIGNEGVTPPLASFAGQLLPEPSDGAWRVSARHLAWHRREVFVGS